MIHRYPPPGRRVDHRAGAGELARPPPKPGALDRTHDVSRRGGHRDAGVGLHPGCVRRPDGDDEALPGDRHRAPARRYQLLSCCWRCRRRAPRAPLAVPRGMTAGVFAVLGSPSCAIGARRWVSTNYAVPAAAISPPAGAHWWPAMDRARFTAAMTSARRRRRLACRSRALTAIHYTAIAWSAFGRSAGSPGAPLRRRRPTFARWASHCWPGPALQLLTGLSNVVFGPLVAALDATPWRSSRPGGACDAGRVQARAGGSFGDEESHVLHAVRSAPSAAAPAPGRHDVAPAQFYVLTKPRVVQIDRVLCGHRHAAGRSGRSRTWACGLPGRHLAGRRGRGGVQFAWSNAHRRPHGARTAWRPTAAGQSATGRRCSSPALRWGARC